MMVSIKKNFGYSIILTCSSYIFSFITFPYVTRVLGVNNIGICNFVDSIIQYFIIISMMGVTTIGIREVAKYKAEPRELSKVFSSLLSINLLFTLFSIIALILSSAFIPKLHQYSQLIYIGVARILAGSLMIEWLYNGLENFRYVAIRSLIIRVLYVILIFLFVNEESDYILYFTLNVFTFVANAALNLIYSKNFVIFSFKAIEVKRFIGSYIILGVYMILTNVYSTFNVMYLGFVTSDTEVGYYTTAIKLFTIVMSIFTAFTGVMMPRMSALLANNQVDDFRVLTSKSLDALFAFTIPLIIISEFCAPQIIYILAGEGYEGAILPMRIVMPLMLIICYEQIIILQILTPMKKDSAILTNSAIGALIGLLLNILLVSRIGSVGSAIVLFLAEVAVLLSAQFFVNRYANFKFPFIDFVKRLKYSIPILILCYVIVSIINSPFISCLILSLVVIVYWLIIECLIIKNSLLIESFKRYCHGIR